MRIRVSLPMRRTWYLIVAQLLCCGDAAVQLLVSAAGALDLSSQTSCPVGSGQTCQRRGRCLSAGNSQAKALVWGSIDVRCSLRLLGK